MGRNDSPGHQILAMEGKILSGIEFWKNRSYAGIENEEEEMEKLKSAPERVISRIMNSRKSQIDLSEDMFQIANRLEQINTNFIKKTQNHEHMKVPFLKNLLKLQHQSSFCQFLSSLE